MAQSSRPWKKSVTKLFHNQSTKFAVVNGSEVHPALLEQRYTSFKEELSA